jgi:hypothetical protein
MLPRSSNSWYQGTPYSVARARQHAEYLARRDAWDRAAEQRAVKHERTMRAFDSPFASYRSPGLAALGNSLATAARGFAVVAHLANEGDARVQRWQGERAAQKEQAWREAPTGALVVGTTDATQAPAGMTGGGISGK